MRVFPKLIGVIHLPALAGAPSANQLSAEKILERACHLAVQEARVLERAGFEALIIENYGDGPFFKAAVPAETTASMAVIAQTVKASVKIPIGLNFLRNDAASALATAAVTGCEFIRVNVLSGVVATDQGLIEGCAAELLRDRTRLRSSVMIFADAHVKHAKTLSSDDLATMIEDLVLRAQADAVIVTGKGTGKSVDMLELEEAATACRSVGAPLYVGSGSTPENISELRRFCDGVIVSSSLRKMGIAGAPLDLKAVSAFVRAYKRK